LDTLSYKTWDLEIAAGWLSGNATDLVRIQAL